MAASATQGSSLLSRGASACSVLAWRQTSALGCARCEQRASAGVVLGVSEKELLCFMQAVTLQGLLPEVMQQLQDADGDISMKALTVLRNALRLADGQVAGPIALQLPERLLPLFENVRLVGKREVWPAWPRGT